MVLNPNITLLFDFLKRSAPLEPRLLPPFFHMNNLLNDFFTHKSLTMFLFKCCCSRRCAMSTEHQAIVSADSALCAGST